MKKEPLISSLIELEREGRNVMVTFDFKKYLMDQQDHYTCELQCVRLKASERERRRQTLQTDRQKINEQTKSQTK